MSTTICRTRRAGGPPRAMRAAGNPLVSFFTTRRRQSQVAPPGARRGFGFDVGGFRRTGLATRSAIEVSWSGRGRFTTVSRLVFSGKKKATTILSSIKQVADPLWPGGSTRSARSAARPCTRCCSFEASEAIPFPGRDSIFSNRCGANRGRLRSSRAALPATETPRFKRSTITLDDLRRDGGAGTNIERLRNSGKKYVERLGNYRQIGKSAPFRHTSLAEVGPGDAAKQLVHLDVPSQRMSSPRKRGSSRGDTTKPRRERGSRRERRKAASPYPLYRRGILDARVREPRTRASRTPHRYQDLSFSSHPQRYPAPPSRVSPGYPLSGV